MQLMRTFKVGSLFAGIGGICLGMQNAKIEGAEFEVVWANEIDNAACNTYRANFTHPCLEGDINLILNPEFATAELKDYYKKLQQQILTHKIDVINGGFPCQAFSIAGERKGFEDERGNLFWSIINLVKLLEIKHSEKPRILLLENVRNLQSHDNGRTYQVIKSEIEKLGYIVKEHIFNTMNYTTLPQTRERIYIVCFRDKADADKFTMFDFPEQFQLKQDKESWEENVKAIIDYSEKAPDKYYYTPQKYPHYFITPEQYASIPEQERPGNRICLDEEVTEYYQFYQLRRGMYVRKNKSNVCPTLTANMGTGGHNVPLIRDKFGIRKLTPQETLRLQGFPAGRGFKTPCSDAMLYKQAGNAVSVPIVTLIATELLKILSNE